MKKHVVYLLCTIIPAFAMAQPGNDEPCGAINIPIINTGSAACNQVDVSMAAATYNSLIGTSAFCGNPSITHPDTWYRFTMPASGKVIIHTSVGGSSPDTDAGMQLYSAANCSDPLTFEACDDDTGPGNMPMISFSGTAGNTYYIRFLQYDGGTDGNYNICITNPAPPLSTSNVGIGITGADSTLDVNGNMKVRGGTGLNNLTVASTLTIKSGNPGANKILTSDAAGVATWQTPPVIPPAPTPQSEHPAVIATFETGNVPNEIDLSNGVQKRLHFRTEQVDNGNMFNDSVFTAPSQGVYSISLQVQASATGLTVSPTANAIELQVEPLQTGSYFYSQAYFPAATAGIALFTFNKLYVLNTGDRLQFNIQRLGTGGTVKINASIRNFISIYKVY